MKKMGDLADSKRNMKIDFRPRAVMRIMRLELLILLASLSMCIGMPLYFIKFRVYKEKYEEEYYIKKEEKAFEMQQIQDKQEVKMLRTSFDQADMTLTTLQKGKIMGDLELNEKIARLEKQIKSEAIRNERRDKKQVKEEL
jgi:hypothetical protein